jgi:glutaredoxin 3
MRTYNLMTMQDAQLEQDPLESSFPHDSPGVPADVATVYSKDSCSFCIRAKMLLEQTGAKVELVDLTGNLDGMRKLSDITGRLTMPQVFVGDELIGGYEDLVLALRNPRIRESLGI